MDHELVALAQQGDQRAFESLTLAHHTRLFRVAHGILRDRHLAEDATQQAFLDIWRYIRRLRDPAKFNGWCYRLLVHACYAEARRKKSAIGEVGVLSEDIADRTDEFRPVIERDELERAFGQMSLDHRAVIVLRHLLGMTPDEAADVLGISREAVYSRLRCAIPALKAALEADARLPVSPSTRRVAMQLPHTSQVGRWLLFVVSRPTAQTPTTGQTTDYPAQPHPGQQRPHPHRFREDPVHVQSSQGHGRWFRRLRYRRRTTHRPTVRPAQQRSSSRRARRSRGYEHVRHGAQVQSRFRHHGGYPTCEQDASGTFTFPFVTAEAMTGTFDGVRVQDGVLEYGANGDFTYTTRGLFMGTVEGCGAGTVHFEARAEGISVDGIATYSSNIHTAVSGGTLPVFGTLDMSGVEMLNDDGTKTVSYTGTYSCDTE